MANYHYNSLFCQPKNELERPLLPTSFASRWRPFSWFDGIAPTAARGWPSAMASRCEPFSGVGGLLLLSWEIGAEGGSRTRRPCLEPPPSDTGTVTSVGSDPLFPHKGHHHHQRKRRVCGASRKQLAYLRNFQIFSFHVCP